MRKAVLWFALVVGVLVCGSAIALAAAPAPTVHVVARLAVDPYLGTSEVSTVVPMVPRCPCHIISSCGFQQIGFDCAEPAHCCSCRGTDPATRLCVGVPS